MLFSLLLHITRDIMNILNIKSRILFVFILSILSIRTIAIDAQQAIDSLRNLIPKTQSDAELVRHYRVLAWYFSQVDQDHLDSTIFYCQKSINLSEKTNNRIRLGSAYFILGLSYYEEEQFEESLAAYLKAYEIFEENNDSINIAATYNNIGLLYDLAINQETAIKYYIKALKISEQLKDSMGMSVNYNNIGLIYKELGNYEKASWHLKKSLEIELKLVKKEGIAQAYSNLGKLSLKKNNIDEAYQYLNEAYQLFQHVKSADSRIDILANFGAYYIEIQQADSAKIFIQKAIREGNSFNRKRRQAYNYFLLGRYNMLIEKYSVAISNIEKAIKISKSINVKDELFEYYEAISQAYLKTQDYKNAHLNLQISNSIKESRHHETVTKRLTHFEKQAELLRIQAEFQFEQHINKSEFEMKELRLKLLAQSTIIVIILLSALILILIIFFRNKTKANKLLKQQNEIIEHQAKELKISIGHLEEREVELEQSNNSKDKLFSIIAHDLKNPFNIILGYADILNTEYEDFNETEVKRMINEIDKSSKITYNLLDNLLTWSRSQQGKIEINKELYNLKHLVDRSCEPYKLNANNKNIKITTKIPLDYKLFVDKFTISTIIGNLLSNAIKFTPEGGLIKIYAESDNNNIRLNFKDNGIGMSAETTHKLFSKERSDTTLGTNNESGTGLGLFLCQDFAKKNGGEISVISELGKGSIFTLTIPISKI